MKWMAVAVIAAAMNFTSCQSEMERDANTVAEKTIEVNQVSQTLGDRSNLHGDYSVRKNKVETGIKEIKEIRDKYKNDPQKKEEFENLVAKKISEKRK
jgi:hypothetical protein